MLRLWEPVKWKNKSVCTNLFLLLTLCTQDCWILRLCFLLCWHAQLQHGLFLMWMLTSYMYKMLNCTGFAFSVIYFCCLFIIESFFFHRYIFFVVFTFIPLLSKIIINKSLVEIFELFTCRLCSLPRILLGEVIIVHITDNILLYRIKPRSNSYGVFVKDGKRCNLYKMPPACTANPKVRFIL